MQLTPALRSGGWEIPFLEATGHSRLTHQVRLSHRYSHGGNTPPSALVQGLSGRRVGPAVLLGRFSGNTIVCMNVSLTLLPLPPGPSQGGSFKLRPTCMPVKRDCIWDSTTLGFYHSRIRIQRAGDSRFLWLE